MCPTNFIKFTGFDPARPSMSGHWSGSSASWIEDMSIQHFQSKMAAEFEFSRVMSSTTMTLIPVLWVFKKLQPTNHTPHHTYESVVLACHFISIICLAHVQCKQRQKHKHCKSSIR